MGASPVSYMPDSLFGSRASNAETEITLGLLTAIERDSSVTQRSAAMQLGIALGLANAYLKRCIKKGLIKVRQAPPNRYAYYLTPKGFAEKSRLTARYLSMSFDLFRSSRQQLTELLDRCTERGWRRIAFYGASELVEIGAICALDMQLEVLGVVDTNVGAARFAGLTVYRSVSDIPGLDAVIVTDLSAPQDAYDTLKASAPLVRVLAPQLLNISQA